MIATTLTTKIMTVLMATAVFVACSSDETPPSTPSDQDASTDDASDGGSEPVDTGAADTGLPVGPCGSCAGCCKGTMCIAKSTDKECGKNGSTCRNCQTPTTKKKCNLEVGFCE